MARYDVLTEATIIGARHDCFEAVVAEAEGRSTWWEPFVYEHRRGTGSVLEIGTVTDVEVHWMGHPGGPLSAAKWAARTAIVEPDRTIAFEFFDGDFLGTQTWRFRTAGDAHTHIAVRFVADPVGALRLRSRLVPLARRHNHVVEEGFIAMERYLASNAAQRRYEELAQRRYEKLQHTVD
jgi:hypothetical protein